jgi:Lhr-like helicase
VTRAPAEPKETNSFFRSFYAHVALARRGVEAREHTAQVPADVREERERRFREGDLPVLYCSPTMELGVR